MLRGHDLFVLLVMAIAGAPSAVDAGQAAVSARCELPEGRLLLREGDSVQRVGTADVPGVVW